jgi:competence protein ComEA
MKQFFRDYFTFNKRERNGVFILLSIIFVLILYLNISSNFINTQPVDFTKFEKDIAQFNASLKESKDTGEQDKEYLLSAAMTETAVETKIERFDFNPSNLSESNWKRLGLSEKQIHTIKNYESKGGKFRTKNDLKKMYCINEELYNSLEPYIKIEEIKSIKNSLTSTNTNFINNKFVNIIELNTADSAQLIGLKGIGAFYAKAIIKYRNSLGGFFSKEQLMEVWKFDKTNFDEIEQYVTVDASKIKKVNINTCEAVELKRPYIKWNVANAIVNYRKSHGNYKAIAEIKNTDLVDEELYSKIVFYLSVE